MSNYDAITIDNDSSLAGNVTSPSGRIYRAMFAVAFIAGGAVVGHGLTVASAPEPETKTVTLPMPPACADAIDAARDERAHTEIERQHASLADDRAAELAAAALSLDPEAIEDAATALDAEKRLVQQAQLDRAAAATQFDDAAGDCRPEVDR